jgi:glycosyltransferase involved in cell wall biosynthesis
VWQVVHPFSIALCCDGFCAATLTAEWQRRQSSVDFAAICCGVPALGYDVGGIREVVKNGVTGALRPVGDLDGLSEFAVALLRDQARWSAMSAAAAADARERFSSDQIVARYERLYLQSRS